MHSDAESETNPSARRLSYKFQRLRERIRAAVAAGELAGKLPGERSLARQFNVNAKTLSKALTDLAAEGVLERNIGLGTFVRDADAAPAALKIMLLTTAGDAMSDCLRQLGVETYAHTDPSDLPPSLLARFDLVIVGADGIDDTVIRDLLVRGKTVLTLDRIARPFVAHAVLTHLPAALTEAARQLADHGHRRVLVVGNDEGDPVVPVLTEAFPAVQWVAAGPDAAAGQGRAGFTAAVCTSPALGRRVTDGLRDAGVPVPDAFSVTAAGRLRGDAPCSGHYVVDSECGHAVATVLRSGLPQRPLALWLAGSTHDAGTVGRVPAPGGGSPSVAPAVP